MKVSNNIAGKIVNIVLLLLMTISLSNYVDSNNEHYLIYANLCGIIMVYIKVITSTKKSALITAITNKKKIEDSKYKADLMHNNELS